MPETEEPHPRIYRRDYQPPPFLVDRLDLCFDLDPKSTVVRATTVFRRNPRASEVAANLVLDGDELELRTVRLDGKPLDATRFLSDPQTLQILDVPDRFALDTEVVIRPSENTKLMGLFQSNRTLCTQCEAEGFRRMTYSLDRPDVMTRFSTRIEADRGVFPVLLSNGNRVGRGELSNGRHWVQWEDPFLKPSYLFALVAGDLVCHRGTFTTMSGREVRLEIWVEPENASKCEHALESLKAAMKWDEETYGLEYDLDVYMVVAVNDFNMGAMENKGLNVFNAKYVLANPATANDDDYEAIESVIGHEYFHNWTGNRVTCRDWFQLTLKEGLTVFRDQEFSSDMTSRSVQRIKDVVRLRTSQFAEDAGPLAHPIRPESYVEMSNFYTTTVYEKGAEVVRLYQTILGADGFRKGLRHYLETHDGCAVTCDDFRQAMAEANNVDLTELERWYSQAGTPVVRARGEWDAASARYTLTLSQSQRAIGAGVEPLPLPIPVRVGLIDEDGAAIPGTDRLLELREREESFVFDGLAVRPIPSVARGFSAPIKLELDRSLEELAFLMANDSDAFNRWEAGQELAKRVLLDLIAGGDGARNGSVHPALVGAFREVLADPSLDGSIRALTLTLPSEELLAQAVSVVDPEAVHRSRNFVVQGLAHALRGLWLDSYEKHAAGSDAIEKREIDRRRIKNRALRYLTALEDPKAIALATRQFRTATGMTDYEAAFLALIDIDSPETNDAIASFHDKWKSDPLVLDKWFRMQAMSSAPSAFDRVVALSAHADFELANPNRARSLLYAFAVGNPVHFHRPDGDGYRFVADHVVALDALNPQVAARVAGAFSQWRRYEPVRRGLMRAELERIASSPSLSKDVTEIVTQALKEP